MASILSVIFSIIYTIVIVAVIVLVIEQQREPVWSFAWAMTVIFIPVAGLILFILFGYRPARKRLVAPPRIERSERIPFITLLENNSDAKLALHNNLDVLHNGDQTFASIAQALESARESIHIEYYIFCEDEVGNYIAEQLERKAREGVEVRLIFDAVGSWKLSKEFISRLRASGVEVGRFSPITFPYFTHYLNYRNHRKIAIIDGSVGFIGGMNIANRYLRGVPWGAWRDTSLCISGMAVQGLQTVFLMDWCFVTGQQVSDTVYFPLQDNMGHSQIQIVTSKPVGRWREIMQGYLHAIASARRYIYIQTPYFMPTEQILTALQTAALSGVDVRIMLPWKSDSRVVQMCSRSYLRDVMEAGVKVLFYHHGFLHAKTLVIDDRISSIGSTNIDFRSFEYNFEVNAFMYDSDTALRLRDIFLADQRHCTHISSQRWARRSPWRKVEESVLRLFAPLM